MSPSSRPLNLSESEMKVSVIFGDQIGDIFYFRHHVNGSPKTFTFSILLVVIEAESL
jgi:hypothetical protein